MKIRLFFGSILLALLVFGYFSPSLTYHFSDYDDSIHISSNRLLQPVEWKRISYFWRYPFNRDPVVGVPDDGGRIGAPYEAIYSPLSFTVWSLLTGVAHAPRDPLKVYTFQPPPLNPAIFHGFNILLHAGNAVLLFLLLWRLTQNGVAAWIAALVFALHPVQIEPVCQCTGMNNLLAGLLGLLSFHCYLGAVRGRYILATFLFTLSLLAKPSAIPLIFVLLGLSWLWERKSVRHYVFTLGPWLLLALASALINRSLQSTEDLKLAAPLLQRPFVVGDSLAWYLCKVCWPFPLTPDYGRRYDWVLVQTWGHFTWLFPATILFALAFWAKAARSRAMPDEECEYRVRVGVMTGLFLLALVPTSGLVGYYFAVYSTVADRYLYLPLLSLSCAFALILDRLLRGYDRPFRAKSLAWRIAGTVWFVALLAGGRGTMPAWGDDDLLWNRTYLINPHSWLALLSKSRQAARLGDKRTALMFAGRAVTEYPQNWILLLHYASILRLNGDTPGAIQSLQKVLELFPGSVTARLNYGMILLDNKEYVAAARQFAAGLQIQNYDPQLLGGLGVALCRAGDGAEGSNYLKEALRWGFNPAVAHTFIGIAQAQRGQFSEAKRELLLGEKANPNLLEALYNLGLLYQKEGDNLRAESYFRRTIKSEPHYHLGYLALAQLDLGRGDKAEARSLLKTALTIKPDFAAARALLAATEK